MHKDRSGMDFRDLYSFNVAFLGKHVWKCIDKLDMLVSRVLISRYFPEGNILSANKGQGELYLVEHMAS